MNISEEKSKKEMEKRYEELAKEEAIYRYNKKELEAKRDRLIIEKRMIEKYKEDLYNEYFKLNRGQDFILLNDIPPFEYISGKKCIISDYSTINLLDLCKCLKEIYKRYNIDFTYALINKAFSYQASDRYDTWWDSAVHPCVEITINDDYNFYLPLESTKNGNTSNVKLIQKYIEEDYKISYKDNYYKELPFEYKRYITIRDLIYSITYFKYQNKMKEISSDDFDVLIYKPMIKRLSKNKNI